MLNKNNNYQERFYRKWAGPEDLITAEIIVGETDLFLSAEKDLKKDAEKIVIKYRKQLEDYIKLNPVFKTSFGPLEEDPRAPDIIKDMIHAAKSAGVGPMAAVAGALAEFTGRELLNLSDQIIIENGGDIFIKSKIERHISVFAGESPLTNKLFIKIKPHDTPAGICTSSGTVGYSFSFGKADACVIIAENASLADAAATAVCNRVCKKEDIRPCLEYAVSIKGVKGVLIVYGKDFGVSGDIELI
jgi:uncharacterized protein